jgi:membrane protein YqaA with SNARE-associated domain
MPLDKKFSTAGSENQEPAETPSKREGQASAGLGSRLMQLPRRLYFWVLGFAHSPHSERALFGLAFAESSFFPIPPDALLIPLVLGKPGKWLRFAGFCTLASVLGGVFGFGIGYWVWSAVSEAVFAMHLPGLSPEKFEIVAALFRRYDFWIVFAAGFTPIPYKVITISAGLMAVSPAVGQPLAYFGVFLLASAIGRGARFYLVAWLCRKWGPPVLPFIDKYFGWLTLAFLVLLAGGFYALRFLH